MQCASFDFLDSVASTGSESDLPVSSNDVEPSELPALLRAARKYIEKLEGKFLALEGENRLLKSRALERNSVRDLARPSSIKEISAEAGTAQAVQANTD